MIKDATSSPLQMWRNFVSLQFLQLRVTSELQAEDESKLYNIFQSNRILF